MFWQYFFLSTYIPLKLPTSKNSPINFRTYEAFRYTFSRTRPNSTFQAFLKVFKNDSKTCAIWNYAKKKLGGCSLYKTLSSKNFFFLKIQKRANFREFWNWEVTNFFRITPNFLPKIKLFCKNHQKSTNVDQLSNYLDKSLFLLQKYIGYKFYGCTIIFEEIMIFWKNKFL